VQEERFFAANLFQPESDMNDSDFSDPSQEKNWGSFESAPTLEDA
jgi:hypothetical protein